MSMPMESLQTPSYATVTETRIYRPSSGYKIAYLLLGLILTPAGVFLAWFFATVNGPYHDPFTRLLLPASSLLLAVAGLATVLYVVTHRLVLRPDGIESSWLLYTDRMPHEAIVGKISFIRSGVPTITLISRMSEVPNFEFRLDFQTDAVFNRWFHAIPDLQGLQIPQIKDLLRQEANAAGQPVSQLLASKKKMV
jgi:hypothetical protein